MKDTEHTYKGKMVNISSNGFAFVIDKNGFMDAKGKKLELKIHNFKLLEECTLKGSVIRVTDDDGKYIVGCRMPEDNIKVLNYVNENYKE